VFQVMADDVVKRIEVQPDQPFSPAPGIELELFSVPGKAPLWGEGETVETEIDDGRTVGVSIEAGSGRKALYIPGCAAMTEALRHRIKGATLVFFDGTLFTDDEMIRLGLGPKTGRRMGHMPVSGPGGTLEAFSTLEVRQKVFSHCVCNTKQTVRRILSTQKPKRKPKRRTKTYRRKAFVCLP
jgi:pyrroloquinoline quinone biosynthesis protein B